MTYAVALYRSDRGDTPIILYETKNMKEAVEALKQADAEWVKSTSEKRPFRMTTPFHSSFLPSLIYEIKLLEIDADEKERLDFIKNATGGKDFSSMFNHG